MSNAAIEAAFEATRRRIEAPGWADEGALPAAIGTDLDGLAEDVPPHEWSDGRRTTFEALRGVKPRQALAVLTMARDEAPFLPEWIAHHLAIGADRIFVYTNNNSDGTDRLLHWFSQNAPVVPIHTTAAPGVNIQWKNYEHAVFLLPELRLYEWVAVVDVDEFLVPEARFNHHLPTMLAATPRDTDSILFPWRSRLWDRAFAGQPGLLAERYPHAFDNALFKHVTRTGRITSLRHVHAPSLDWDGVVRDTAFVPVEDVWDGKHRSTDGGWVDHYWAKSFEEFIVKKRRGDSLELADGNFKRSFEEFFTWTFPGRSENHLPLPESLLAAVKHELGRFEAMPGYGPLKAALDGSYATFAAQIREDAELRRIYNEFVERYPWP
jgi:hypothetical protein